MQSLLKRRHFAKDIIRRSFSEDAGNKHPILTSLAKAAGVKANNLRNAETTKHKHRLDTILSHAGLPTDDTNAPLTPPLHLSSTYMRPASGDYGSEGLVYSRVHNPTRILLEQTMSRLETVHTDGRREDETSDSINATAAAATSSFAFSSGMAAVSSIVMATPSPLHIILPDDVYWGTPNVLLTVFKSQEQNNLKDATISHSMVDMTQIKQVEEKIIQVLQSKQPLKTILVWMETPSNPQCKVIDIQRVCQTVHQIQKDSSRWNSEVDIVTVVDSTLAPPIITQPLLVRNLYTKE
jgi:cystathionine gamma-synthase